MDERLLQEVIAFLGDKRTTSNALTPGDRAVWRAERDHLVMGLRRFVHARQEFSAANPALDYLGIESVEQLLTRPPVGE